MSIFDCNVLRLCVGPSGPIRIDVLGCEELRNANRGHPRFVRAVLQTVVENGGVYDDSDDHSLFVHYLPASQLQINGQLVDEEALADGLPALQAPTTSLPLDQRSLTAVWISHKHGTSTWVCASEELAWDVLYQWAKRWWQQEVPDEPLPTGHDEAVRRYFEIMEDRGEHYSIGSCGLITQSQQIRI